MKPPILRRVLPGLGLLLVLAGPLAAGEIHDAAGAGDADRLRAVLARDSTAIAARDAEGRTPLHVAVAERRADAIRLLLARGAAVDARDGEGYTPLHRAAFAGDSTALAVLLGAGAAVDVPDPRGRTALGLACGWGNDRGAVRILIAAGADVNAVDAQGTSILVSVLHFGRREIVDELLDHGARVPDDERAVAMALDVAAGSGFDRVFRLAVEQAERRGTPWWSRLSMQAAARGGAVAIGEALRAKGLPVDGANRYGVTPLHVAAEYGRTDFAVYLLDHGARLDRPDFRGRTALYIAGEGGFTDLVDLLRARGASSAPPRFPHRVGPWLGEPAPADTPQRFAPGVVSAYGPQAEHSPPVFSPDGREVWWTARFRGPILGMRREHGVWTAPAPAPFGSGAGDGEPAFSPDGRRIFFLSSRPLASGERDGAEHVWWVERRGRGWSAPQPLPGPVNAMPQHWTLSLAADGTLYFSSVRAGGAGGHDLFRSRRVNGRYEEPEDLGPTVNSAGDEYTPFVAPDQSYLLFASTGHGAVGGRFQLFVSYRTAAGGWGEPIPVASRVPIGADVLGPTVSPDGRYLFYLGGGDVWWVRADFLEALRPTMAP